MDNFKSALILLVAFCLSFQSQANAQEQKWVLNYSIKGVDIQPLYLTLLISGLQISGSGKASDCPEDIGTISGTIDQGKVELVFHPIDRVHHDGQGFYFSGHLKNEIMSGYWSFPYNIENKSYVWIAKTTELSANEAIEGWSMRACNKPT